MNCEIEPHPKTFFASLQLPNLPVLSMSSFLHKHPIKIILKLLNYKVRPKKGNLIALLYHQRRDKV